MAHANDTNTAAAKPVNNQHPHIHALFVGQPKTITDERGTWTSSIYRDPVGGPVLAQPGGLVGDKVAQPYHGGPDADICVHLLDHYRFWNAHYGMNLQAGFVGENFTLDGIHEAEICVGDLVRVGTALVQVTGPRIPCANLARRGYDEWLPGLLTVDQRGPIPVAVSGAWVAEETFVLRYYFYQTPFCNTTTLQFTGEQVTYQARLNVSFGPTEFRQLVGRVA